AVPLRATISVSAPSTNTVPPTSSSSGAASSTWNDPSSPCGRPMRPAKSPSVNDVDEHAALLAHRRRLDDGPQRVGRPAAAADDLAVVVLGDGELEHD